MWRLFWPGNRRHASVFHLLKGAYEWEIAATGYSGFFQGVSLFNSVP